MIFFAPACSTTLAVIKRFGRPLLALPLCMLLISCDSASSNTDNEGMTSKLAPTDNIENSDLQNTSDNVPDNADRQSDSANESTEGQSLIAAAQLSNNKQKSQSLNSESPSRTLQATLMGDYGGMVPCTACDSVGVTLNLFADGSVLKNSIYNNPEQPRTPLLESGVYRQDDDKITIVYEDKHIETYQIQDSHLILMDEEKMPDDDYTLSRQ